MNSLETELVQKDIELEEKELDLKLQKKKIENLLLKVCLLNQKINIQSRCISDLENKVKDLNKNSLQVIFYVDAHYRKQLISFEKTLNLNIA